MVRSAEQQIAELAERLGLPPSAAPTAGAAAAAAVRDTSPAVSQPQVAAAAAAAAAAAVNKPQKGRPAKEGQQAVMQPAKQQETAGEAAAGGQPALPPQQAQQVEVVAASGRVLLKRDRSKQYTPANKRHEGLQEAGEQPQSSDSSMQSSQGDPSQQQQHSDSGASRPRGGGGNIMQRTRAALHLWKALRVRCPAVLFWLCCAWTSCCCYCRHPPLRPLLHACMHGDGWAVDSPLFACGGPPPPPPDPLSVLQSNASTPSTVLGKPAGGGQPRLKKP
jgi:hypothetical protein